MTTKYRSTVPAYASYEEFVEARKQFIGGSDIASVLSAGRYGCARNLAYDKRGESKDFDDTDKMEFRRGRRLEGIAADYYATATGRATWTTTTAFVPGKPHLAVNMDRLTAREGRGMGADDGYLEIKIMGRFAFIHAKKHGLIDDYILQIQYGCAVAGLSWGAFAIYCPDLDELLTWDVVADRELGDMLLEKADDFWSLNVECRILPPALNEGSKPCEGCVRAIRCRGVAPVPAGVVSRPDLEGLAAKLAEVKGMGTESGQAEEELRGEFIAAVKGVPGMYLCGKYEVPFTITTQKRFSGDLLKKKNPTLYEECKADIEIKTVRKPKEI